MWHEARRQERLIRGMMVDYKKRAERRREYYEKIKLDPTQFLRIHGRISKIHLDPAVAAAAESPATMMPWQGDSTHMIDRFDVRAHLDYIPHRPPELPSLDDIREEQRCNYERYRTLVHNDHAGIVEDQCLHQIYVEEMFPDIQKKPGDDKGKLAAMRAAIGFSYDTDGTTSQATTAIKAEEEEDEEESDSDSDVSFSEIDLDVVLDVEELSKEQKSELNITGEKYGMAPDAFMRMLEREKEEADDFKRAKEEEEEKAMYSGRKSRRERRAIIERKLKERRSIGNSPPSYAARGSPTYDPYKRSWSRSSSSSRGSSPEEPGKVTFITSFGGEDDGDEKAKQKEKEMQKKSSSSSSSFKQHPGSSTSLTPSTDSHSKSWHRRDRHRSSSRSSQSRSRSRSRSRSPSLSRSREQGSAYRQGEYRPKGRLPSNPQDYHKQRSWRRSNSRSSSRSRSRSRDRHRRSRSRSSDRHAHSYTQGRYCRSRSRSTSRDRYHSQQFGSRSPPRYHRSRSRSKSPPHRQGIVQTLDMIRKEKEEKIITKAAASANKPKLTPQEKMKLRMQKALNKQHKADKIKEYQKKNCKLQEQEDRDNELREQGRRMRRREREKRDREREKEKEMKSRHWRSRSSSRSRSLSRSRSRSLSPPPGRSYRQGSPPTKFKYRRSRSRSRSVSPPSHYRY